MTEESFGSVFVSVVLAMPMTLMIVAMTATVAVIVSMAESVAIKVDAECVGEA